MIVNKTKISPNSYRDVEYRMSKEQASMILKTRKDGSSLNTQEYLCKYVNEQLGVKGNCVVVTTAL